MKTKTKKYGVFAVLAVALLLSVALVTTCVDSLSPGGLTIPQEKEQTAFVPPPPPPGKGYLQLKIVNDESQGRTILPTAVPTIGEYEIVLATTAVPPVITTLTRVTSIASTITVNTGTYNVEVRGYKTVGDTEIVGVGSASAVQVTTSGTTGGVKAITLQEIYTGTGDYAGEGILSWNFNLTSANLTVAPAGTATLNVTNWGGATNTIPGTLTNVSLSLATPASVTGSGTLPSGYYYVDVTLAKTASRTQTYREIVHIANGLTSNWTKNDFVALARNVYTVTYDSHGGTTVTATNNVAHGTAISAPTPPPTLAGYTLDGWYRTYTPAVTVPTPAPEVYANPWTFTSAEKVISDLTLHAKWTEISTGNLQITVAFTNLDHIEQTFDLVDTDTIPNPVTSITFSNAALYDNPNATITVVLDNATSTFTGGVRWTYGPASDLLVLSTSDTLVIDFSDDDHYAAFSGVDEYPITIEGKIGTVPYTTIITLSITP